MNHLYNAYLNQKLCDVQVIVTYLNCVKTYNTHKVVLYSQCEYFKNIYDNNFDEAQKGVFHLTCASSKPIFDILLNTMYNTKTDCEEICGTLVEQNDINYIMEILQFADYLCLDTQCYFIEEA